MSNFRKRLVDLTDRFASTIDAVHDADAQYDFVMNNDPDYVAGYRQAEADLRISLSAHPRDFSHGLADQKN